jgi:hypothetical protein
LVIVLVESSSYNFVKQIPLNPKFFFQAILH